MEHLLGAQVADVTTPVAGAPEQSALLRCEVQSEAVRPWPDHGTY